MSSSFIKIFLAVITLILTQWTVLTHAKPTQVEADKTETTAGYESVTDNPWLKSQINPQTPDYPESVSVGTGNSYPRDTSNSVFIREDGR